jgi:SAM-dependent methyltransferase
MNKLEHIYQQEKFGENWFSYPNLYSDIVKQFPSGSKFVEVGSWKGKSSAYMAVEIANSEKEIEFFCVDTWEGGPDHQDMEELSQLYVTFLNNMKPLENYYSHLKTTSLEAVERFEDNSLDFVFIDASHEYEDVKNDINAWLPKVKPGGILAGHDYYPEGTDDWFPGVKRAVNESLDNFELSDNCYIYRKEEVNKLKNKDIKVLFFGRENRDEVWEYDFILKEILPEKEKDVKFLTLEQVRNCDEKFDVFVYSARCPNNYTWGYTPSYEDILESILKTNPKIIIQLSDEYKDEDLEHYNNLSNYCELFLRQYNHQEYRNNKFKTNFRNDNIVYIPLGYGNNTPVGKISNIPLSEKKYNWSFIGKIKDWEFCFFDDKKQKWVSVSDRSEMIEIFKNNIQNFFFAQEGISKDDLIKIYSDSIFVPCGRGNSSLECFRNYEASMCGAIPIVVGPKEEIENTFKYEENPPWVFAESWDEAVEKCKDLLNDKDHLQEIQNNLLDWWSNRIRKIQDKVNEVFVKIECKEHSYKLHNFPPINFISVDKSEDRRKLLYEKFAKYNLTNIRPHIFEVYDDKDHHYIGESFRELNGIGRGPTTSHLKAIKDWYFDTDEEYAFFCEDDISFEPIKYWNFTWEEFFNSLPEDWECIQLCWVREGDMFVFSTGGLKLRHRCWCDWSACAYLIKRSHAKKLISNYYRNGSFNLDFVGNDSHVRPKWAKDPVAETIIFSPLGNPKNIDVNVSVVYGFPLFVEDVYNCESELLKYDCGNVLFPQRDCHEISHNTILNWWETKGKNLKVKDIIDI